MESLIYDIVAAVTLQLELHQARAGERVVCGSQGTGNGREPFTSCLHFNAHPGYSLFITNVFIEHY